MSVRVLILEDEAIVALDLRRQVEELGHVVCGIHSDAESALAAGEAAAPDLAIMDIRLVGSADGLVAAEEFYVCSGVPVILVSAYPDAATLARARRSGAYAFVPKPFSAAALAAAIDLTLGKHAELRQATETARLLRCAVDHAAAAIVVTDVERRIALINPAATRLLDVGSPDVQYRDLGAALLGIDGWASLAALTALAPGGELRGTAHRGAARFEARVVRSTGARDAWTWTLAAATGASGA